MAKWVIINFEIKRITALADQSRMFLDHEGELEPVASISIPIIDLRILIWIYFLS